MPSALVTLTLSSQVAPQIAQTASAYKTLSAEEQKAERGATSYAQALQKVALADARTATEEQRLAVQTANVAKAQTQAELSALRLANAQNQAASGSGSFAQQLGSSVKDNLLGIVAPAALATAGLAALKGALDFTAESFKLKAALDQTNLSINLQLKNFRDVNQTLQDGRQFAERYAITQQENASAIQASIPLLRQSKASLSDVEGVLSRLAVLKPEQGIQGAAFALAELEGGQSRSLATRFNIPIAKATELKNAIKNGGDAIQVMDQYLNSVGVDMSTLDVRTQGAAGKMNRLAAETERFSLALGGQAGGLGESILDTKIIGLQTLTADLTGKTNDLATANQAYALTLIKTGDFTAAAAERTRILTDALNSIPPGLPNADRVKDDLLAITKDAHAAAAAILEIPGSGAQPLPHLNDKAIGAVGGLGDRFTKGFDVVAQASADADQKTTRLADLQFQNQLINAKTSGAKIAILRAQLAKATNDIDRQSIQNQIDQEKQSGAGRVSSAESTALKLNDIARTSGDNRARIERENLEKLRDAQQDFDVRSSRAQEDYEEKRRKLLAGGQRAQAAALAADFAKDRRRAQEDFDRDRQRTVRNNREALGDQGTRVGNQVESIAARTAAHGGGSVGLPSAGGGGALPTLPSAPARQAGGQSQAVAQINLYLDGKKFAEAIWTPLMPIVDQEFAASLQAVGFPGSGQPAVAGVG